MRTLFPFLSLFFLLALFGCEEEQEHPLKDRPVEQINRELESRTLLEKPMDVVNFVYSTMYPDFVAAQLIFESETDPKDQYRHNITVVDTAFADDQIRAMKQIYVLYKGQSDSAWRLEEFKYAWKCEGQGFDTIPCP